MTSPTIMRIQRDYSRIYLACHVRHIRAVSTELQLSSRDSSLLAHLDLEVPVTPGELAAHLGVSNSTLSAAAARLERLGYIRRARHAGDRRVIHLTLSPSGAAAMAATSVLDPERLTFLLNRLTAAERRSAIGGLELLARAAQETMHHFEERS